MLSFTSRSSISFLHAFICTSTIFSFIACTGCDKMCCQDSAQESAQNAVGIPAKAVTPISLTTSTLYLDVQGMHCDGCVKAIDAEARSIDGVSDAQVSLEKHSAQIKISSPELAAKVESAIRSLGYTVTVVAAPN